jgi:hypothetical protein
MAREQAEAIEEVRAVLRERGTVTNRDFEMAARTRTQSYRGRKDSALALYYLWRTGEVMTHHRENFERVYALTESVAPAHLIYESNPVETDRFLSEKEIRFWGLSRLGRTSDAYHGRGEPDRAAKKLLNTMVADGDIVEVKVEGWKAVHYALGRDVKTIRDLGAGRIPKAWAPLATTTTEEAVFLAPLDHVSARGRAKDLFGFDYIWEVYKPALNASMVTTRCRFYGAMVSSRALIASSIERRILSLSWACGWKTTYWLRTRLLPKLWRLALRGSLGFWARADCRPKRSVRRCYADGLK